MRLTVGIPAYNEAQNIGALLKALTSQLVQNGSSLNQILIVSDGSTDATPSIVLRWTKRDPRIQLHELPKRLGKANAVNEIFRLAKGDVIVLVDADTVPIGESFLSELTKPFKAYSDVGVVGAVGIALPSQTLIGRAAVFSSNMRRRLLSTKPYFAFNVGLAVSAKAVRALRLPLSIIGDDAYLFFRIKNQGLKAIVAHNARVLYREPQTLGDFAMQRRRYDLNVIQLRQLLGSRVNEDISVGGALLNAFFREWLCDSPGGTVWLILRVFQRLRRTGDTKAIASSAMSTKGSLDLTPQSARSP
jgi:cellulose synthase/poly-beta-1,6-N-acetylglucosamine synthase-like glycosyltransferase